MNMDVVDPPPPSEVDVSIYDSKFLTLTKTIANWVEPYVGLKGRRILDFGCGEATTALGITLLHQPELMVGVDVHPQFERCESLARKFKGIERLPDNMKFELVERGNISSYDDFDIVYAWSVFEHVDQKLFDGIIRSLHEKLRDGGLLFIQIAPLYYSAEGAHLWDLGWTRWEHLTMQIDHVYDALYKNLSKPHADRHWFMFSTLNRITAPKLIADVARQGFKILRQYTSEHQAVPPDDLLSVYKREVLVTEQVVVLFRKEPRKESAAERAA
jgi:SAM-dependent methyltransferase